MTTYLLAGGGTAGHVNPLLATAATLRDNDPSSTIIVLGTAEGLESRLVPAAGFELVTIPKLPFPRRVSPAMFGYFVRLTRAVGRVRKVIQTRRVDVVVGFGGYAAAPAYLAAALERKPIVVHEANAIPGIANRLGTLLSVFVGITFPGTPLRGGMLVGMPLRREISQLDREATRDDARAFFGLDERPVLLVTGGSTGARQINSTIGETASDIVAAGWQIIHTVGETRDFDAPDIAGYHPLPYCDRMDFALAVADVVVARAGAATVSELAGLGIPTIFVPYPVGNGEQAQNAAGIVAAGGATLCFDANFTPDYVRSTLIPFLGDPGAQSLMAAAAFDTGIRDGAERLAALIDAAVAEAAT